MCYLNEGRKDINPRPDLTEQDVKHIIDQMPPKTLIGLTGGEIFTKPYIFSLIDYAAKHHYCNIVTNGTLITPAIAEKIVASDVLVVGISLDGPQDVHNRIRGRTWAFEKTMQAIKLLQNEKKRQHKTTPKIDLKIVILPENYRYLTQIFHLCEQLHVDFLTISVLKSSPIQLAPPILSSIKESAYQRLMQPEKNIDIDELEQQIDAIVNKKSSVTVRFYPRKLPTRLREYYEGKTDISDYDACTFPWASFNVAPTGSLFPCIALDIGNCTDTSLRVLWNGRKMRQFRMKLKKQNVFPACHGCCNLWFRQ